MTLQRKLATPKNYPNPEEQASFAPGVSQEAIGAFQAKVLNFYATQGRTLPWRNTQEPYLILVSEVMLQQTQVDRVIPYYSRFLEHYPTVEHLANAEQSEVLRLWSGLGYNSRALRLCSAAQAIVANHAGSFPKDYLALTSLPGIGDYTAKAILAFAFNQEVPVIDTNIRRVLLAEFPGYGTASSSALKSLANSLIPPGRSRDWHNALMDYGALVLTAKKTGIAPLSKQSTFKGSDRQIRGDLVRQLLKSGSLSVAEAQALYHKPKLEQILEKLEKDGILLRDASTLRLR